MAVLICESQEVLYEKAMKRMNAERLIVQYAYRMENYRIAAAMFDSVGDYKDAPEMAEKCRMLEKEEAKKEQESNYRKAVARLEKAETRYDWQKVSERFAALKDYKDAPDKLLECEKKLEVFRKKSRNRMLGIGGILVLCTCFLIAGYYTGFYRYLMGVCYSTMEYYHKAEPIFEELDSFLDSEERARECREQIILQKENEEVQALKKAKAGDKVVFGTFKWKVLERADDRLLLILDTVEKAGPFYQVAYHNFQEEVSWENSGLHNLLNEEVFHGEFSKEEKEAMLPVNDDWGAEAFTAVQSDEGDYISILSISQAEAYAEYLKDLTGADYWLRDPGTQSDMAAFTSASGQIMSYGYPVAEAKMAVRPVILVDCARLTGEERA